MTDQTTIQEYPATDHLATYSPDDNKLRLYPAHRLDSKEYAKVKAAGFRWAPRQELFVAPAWSPQRDDLLIEMCGEVGDEDTSLVDRAAERAERFTDYSEKRAEDANRAHAAVTAITDGIPMGQPILVGHHSEKHARRDAEKIENGMRRAVKMWETSKYWTYRAAGAIRHAKYKERPAARARRIKKIESDKRREEKSTRQAETFIKAWEKVTTWEQARAIANYDHVSQCFPLADYPRGPEVSQYEGIMALWSALDGIITAEQAKEIALRVHRLGNDFRARWIAHYENRLAYERAMLADAGGTVADRSPVEKGGAVRCWASPRHGRAWSYIKRVNKVSVSINDNYGNGGANFTRTIELDKLTAIMTAAEVEQARADGRLLDLEDGTGFILADIATEPTAAPQARQE
jgi:hypothetical protein